MADKNLSLVDWGKRVDANGAVQRITEVLSKATPAVEDAVVIEGNMTAGNKSVVRTGLPQGTWRKMYGGVFASKSETQEVTDGAGMLEDYSEPDKALVDMAQSPAEFRMSEDLAFVQGLSQTVASTIFYGNVGTDPEKFTGLAPRFNSKSALNGSQIVDAAGTGSTCTSIWIMNWGEDTTFLFFPRGSRAGLQQNDKGNQTAIKSDGSRYECYRTHFKWDVGMAVRDWRQVVRIANIQTGDIDFSDASDSPGDASYTGPNIISLLTRGMNKLYNLSAPGRTVIYMNRAVRLALDLQVQSKSNLALPLIDWAGRPTPSFWGFPIRVTDSLTSAETQVT